jgi:hypothetical protein
VRQREDWPIRGFDDEYYNTARIICAKVIEELSLHKPALLSELKLLLAKQAIGQARAIPGLPTEISLLLGTSSSPKCGSSSLKTDQSLSSL